MKVAKKRLGRDFFIKHEVVDLAQELLGKVICTNFNGDYCEGMITETEAYSGENDKACHAHMGRFTKRTSIMYEEGGHAYVYLCYGIHHLFNIVTNISGRADAVLIRAIEPLDGVNTMLSRRQAVKATAKVFSGPGKLSQALGIDKSLNRTDLVSNNNIYLIDKGIEVENIESATRIGIEYAGEDALLPWRFYIAGNKYVSKFK